MKTKKMLFLSATLWMVALLNVVGCKSSKEEAPKADTPQPLNVSIFKICQTG